MLFIRRTRLLRYLLLAAILALFLFFTSFWLPQGGSGECGSAWQPCLSFYHLKPELPLAAKWAGGSHDEEVPPLLLEECPGQSFQAWRLLLHLKASLTEPDDILTEPYLQSWDQLLNFMESLGTVVSFFSQKVKEKVVLIRELSLKHSSSRNREDHGKRGPAAENKLQNQESLKHGAYGSVRSMVEAELKGGVVNFSYRTESGCRTLLRLHRSLLWLKLMLEGLAQGPDTEGRFKTPGELSRDAYRVALAPHHHWMLRQAAEFVFLALPDRRFFLGLVCVEDEREAAPVLHTIIHALTLVHTQTQRILAQYDMLELP